MRYWDRLSDPDSPRTRSRSPVHLSPGSTPSQFGQRPMFSVPGPEQPPPEEGRLGSEARLDGVTPVDESPGSKVRSDLIVGEASVPAMFTSSNYNVASPPTDAQLTAAFGQQPKGFAALVYDGGGVGAVWLCVKGLLNTWWYEALTKAV